MRLRLPLRGLGRRWDHMFLGGGNVWGGAGEAPLLELEGVVVFYCLSWCWRSALEGRCWNIILVLSEVVLGKRPCQKVLECSRRFETKSFRSGAVTAGGELRLETRPARISYNNDFLSSMLHTCVKQVC